MTSKTIVPRGETMPHFDYGDRVRVVQSGIRDEYAGATGTVWTPVYWSTGWVYEVVFRQRIYGRSYATFVERELVAGTEESGR